MGLTRLAADSRASTQGDDSSTRRRSGPTIHSIMCRDSELETPQTVDMPTEEDPFRDRIRLRTDCLDSMVRSSV